jgi:hypothetical protein
MRIQPMSAALRIGVTLREARAMRILLAAGADALGLLAPTDSPAFLASLDMGISDVASKQADARARREARKVPVDRTPLRNLLIDGYTICARFGDWIDVSPDPDQQCWITATPEREGQHEIRRGTWQVLVLNPDPYGSMHLADGCTGTGDEAEIEPLARHLVGALTIPIADEPVSQS